MPSLLETILGAAESAIGVGYKWGGNSLATGVDCSGLVQQAFLAAGIHLPRVSASQMTVGVAVATLEEAQPGDLLGWNTGPRNSGSDHIAIYLGNGMMIEAYKTGEPIRVTQVRPGYTIRRVIGHVEPTSTPTVQLGPNQSRTYTTAAVGAAPAPPAQTTTVTGAPEGGMGDGLPDNATPEQVEAYVRENFPDLAAYWGNEEIRTLLTTAAQEDWGDAEIQGALQQTDYWKTHGPSSRRLDMLLAQDRTAAVQVIDAAKGIVADLMSRNGLEFDDKQIGELAKGALRSGAIGFSADGQVFVSNQDQLNGMVAFGLGTTLSDGGLPVGEAAFNADSLMAMARGEYMLPITRRQAEAWAVEMMNGVQTEESIRAELNRRSRERYGYLGLAEGQTVASITDGAVAVVANRLELDPDSIDLLNAQWNPLLEFTDEHGNKRAMTLGEADDWARHQKAYLETTEFRQKKAERSVGLLQRLGLVA